MHALPFLIAFSGALLMAPALLRRLAAAGHTRPNYRGRELPFAFGALVPVAAVGALLPLVLLAKLDGVAPFDAQLAPAALYVIGIACLGLLDDALDGRVRQASRPASARPARGLRGHAAALARGELTTGALKAFGAIALAPVALAALGFSGERWLLASAVVVLSTNVFNQLDVRPGRALKAFALLGGALVAATGELRPLWSLGLFTGPALVAGAYDVRERAMLGDTGSNLLGALAGLWLVLSLPAFGQLVALIALVAITSYGELRSISALVQRTPALRGLDSLGRPS